MMFIPIYTYVSFLRKKGGSPFASKAPPFAKTQFFAIRSHLDDFSIKAIPHK